MTFQPYGKLQAAFTQMGVPAATLVAPAVAALELAGGIALILGVLTRVFALLLAVDMPGALFLVHAQAGIFVGTGGYELVLIPAAVVPDRPGTRSAVRVAPAVAADGGLCGGGCRECVGCPRRLGGPSVHSHP